MIGGVAEGGGDSAYYAVTCCSVLWCAAAVTEYAVGSQHDEVGRVRK